MKQLNELLETDYDITIKGIKTNSAQISPGDLFVCTTGVNVDRHEYIDDAIRRGAVAAVVTRDIIAAIPTIRVVDANAIVPQLFSRFYDNPQKKLRTFGVTGTDGKTSVSTIVQTLLGANNCGLVGTNGEFFGEKNNPKRIAESTENTTPDIGKLYEYFSEFVNAGANAVSMELSSEAIHYARLADFKLDVIGLTNITSEHLNTHGTLENYVEAKTRVFTEHVGGGGGSL